MEHRRAVFLARHRVEFVPDTRTELERVGLTVVPFDQQRVQPDASAYSLPS